MMGQPLRMIPLSEPRFLGLSDWPDFSLHNLKNYVIAIKQ
jgi:hypothetical protein